MLLRLTSHDFVSRWDDTSLAVVELVLQAMEGCRFCQWRQYLLYKRLVTFISRPPTWNSSNQPDQHSSNADSRSSCAGSSRFSGKLQSIHDRSTSEVRSVLAPLPVFDRACNRAAQRTARAALRARGFGRAFWSLMRRTFDLNILG